ncbi:hypothetical protein WA158_003127 [Blastocystis sp. Blastoise]
MSTHHNRHNNKPVNPFVSLIISIILFFVSIYFIYTGIQDIIFYNNCSQSATYDENNSSVKSSKVLLSYPKIKVNKQSLIPYIFLNGSYVNFIDNCEKNNDTSKICESKNIDYYETQLPVHTNQFIFSIENKEISRDIYKESIVSSVDISTLGCSNEECLECIRMGGILNDNKCSVKQYLQNICFHMNKKDDTFIINNNPCFGVQNASQYSINPSSIYLRINYHDVLQDNNYLSSEKTTSEKNCNGNIDQKRNSCWTTIAFFAFLLIISILTIICDIFTIKKFIQDPASILRTNMRSGNNVLPVAMPSSGNNTSFNNYN